MCHTIILIFHPKIQNYYYASLLKIILELFGLRLDAILKMWDIAASATDIP